MNLGSEQTEAERLEAVGIHPVSVIEWKGKSIVQITKRDSDIVVRECDGTEYGWRIHGLFIIPMVRGYIAIDNHRGCCNVEEFWYPTNTMDWLAGDDSALEADRMVRRSVEKPNPGLRRSGMKPFNRMEGGQ